MKYFGAILAGCLLLTGQTSMAAVSDAEIAELKATLALLVQRVDQLAAENADLRQSARQTTEAVAAVQDSRASASWPERIKLKGDFRYRFENDDVSLPDVDSRNRNRIRARVALLADLPGDVEVGFGLASGGDDPVSSNQTLGGGGSSKNVNLDLAYFDWTASERTHVRGGKFKNRLETVAKSQLQWDHDWRPEGFDVRWDDGTFFAQGLGSYLESDTKTSRIGGTEFAYILQAGARAEISNVRLKGGIGYTDINAAGSDCFFDGSRPGDTCAGNSVNAQGQYLYDFQVLDLFAEAAFSVGDLPVSVWGEWINNRDAEQFDTGYQVGARLGKARSMGSWQLSYYYQDLEADATLGLLTNSNFAGGGTDSKGSVFSGAYALTDQSNLKLTYYLTEKQDSLGLVNGGVPFDTDILQLDVNFKYK